ncbi:hypothetical protein SEUCBS140593_004436 [Sporothrix eucalyptigena]|uniref:UBC core domain-containing protein n=1 Tax=Sporothrix eucalyptigena TaxID=1812306 RepID=A0ABP0BNE7_9PEZI
MPVKNGGSFANGTAPQDDPTLVSNVNSIGGPSSWSRLRASSEPKRKGRDNTRDDLYSDEDAEDSSLAYYKSTGQPSPLQDRIGGDLRAIHQHGYYFGVLAGMDGISNENLLSVSVRTSSLRLSPEMMMAWDLDPDAYIVLLIYLKSRYMPFESLLNAVIPKGGLSFRIGKCSHYKPSAADAFAAFGSDSGAIGVAKRGQANSATGFSKILISTSLAHFMIDYFLPLARYKEDYNCSWATAVNDVVNRTTTGEGGSHSNNKAGNFVSTSTSRKQSFPLVALLFAMDQLKNCTEYCQACHARLPKSHRSLKPTVCSRDLCLYQHISLGMGRSVEYEILCQPNVVDLLVNFCYTALKASTMADVGPFRSYPTNLLLKVPDWDNGLTGIYSKNHGFRSSFTLPTPARDKIKQFAPGQWVVIYVGKLATAPGAASYISRGDTLQLPNAHASNPSVPNAPATSNSLFRHAVITSVNFENSTLYVDHLVADYGPIRNSTAEIFRYTKDFDDVEQSKKAAQLLVVLETLPPVRHLKAELEKPTVNDIKSASGVSPAAAVLLGWIIATNRACILQINEPQLMGVPEADHDFQQQLDATVPPDEKHRTLLAWHGSSIGNWHSILRTGLDYSVTTHGRAFGDGVYFSNNFSTSLLYATGGGVQWPKAIFDLRSVVSLNEIINAPEKFKSSNPHYVIKQKHWSRCRFLFAHRSSLPSAHTAATSAGLTPPVGFHLITRGQRNMASAATIQVQPSFPTPPPVVHIGGVPMSTPKQAWVSRPLGGRQIALQTGMATYMSNLIQAPSTMQLAQNATVTASQSVFARMESGESKFFEQDPMRPTHGPHGHVIYVPLASMPSSPRMWEESQHYSKRLKHSSRGISEIMDASDMAFLSREPQGQPAGPRKLATASSPANPLVIDLDSDEDDDVPEATDASQHSPVNLPVDAGVTPFRPGNLDFASLPQLPLPSWCMTQAQRALAREVDRMQKLQANTPAHELGWYIDFSRLDNMFQWIVELHSFSKDLPLAQDMKTLNVQSIVCELRFGPDYPLSPPLVRVIRPRFMPFLLGGGGNVTAGGAMCMELLTSTGWSPANQTDAVLLQVRLALCATDRPARLDSKLFRRDYGIGEAFEAYKRAAATHGWQIPADMQKRMMF